MIKINILLLVLCFSYKIDTIDILTTIIIQLSVKMLYYKYKRKVKVVFKCYFSIKY